MEKLSKANKDVRAELDRLQKSVQPLKSDKDQRDAEIRALKAEKRGFHPIMTGCVAGGRAADDEG
jgi:peptidoglycan hydrolase CwlO-like protein